MCQGPTYRLVSAPIERSSVLPTLRLMGPSVNGPVSPVEQIADYLFVKPVGPISSGNDHISQI
jgi:hypothetical protein